ncbi:MAG: ATP-binding protein, partial [Acidobacteria bacterium]|nr:ATP-binding protein [Acidobacteriota bacterium]
GWEVDFFAHRPGEAPLLVQVCLDTADDATWEREVRALRSAGRACGDASLLLVPLDAPPPPRPLPDRIVWAPAARWLLEDVG